MIDDMNILRKISDGHEGIVYETESSGSHFAVKVFHSSEEFDIEVNNYSKIPTHPNLFQFISAVRDGTKIDGDVSSEVSYITMELCQHEDLLQLMYRSGPIPEEITRYLINSILDGLETLHNNGFAHFDVKLENCLITNDDQVKLADFGFMDTALESINIKKGSLWYQAPEIWLRQPYMGIDADLFAVGVILFTMIIGRPTFSAANKLDKLYKWVCARNMPTFWLAQRLEKFDDEFKDLIEKFIALNPADRMRSVSEVRQHPWMKREMASKKEVVDFIAKIYNK